MKVLHKICATLVLAAAATATAAPPKYTITDLGNGFNPSFGAVYATSVNNRGEVSGWAYHGQTVPQHHAMVWEGGTLTDLGTPDGSYDSAVYGINNRGTYVGHSEGWIAYFSDGAWTKLGVAGSANDVNDRGTIVGNYNASGTRAFMLRNGVFMDLGTLGPSFAYAFAVNGKDVAVGYSYDNAFHTRAFVYEKGAMRDIGTLGGTGAYAYDINDHGVVVGASDDGLGHTVAFVYERGVMRPLFATNTVNSMARSINDHGDIVGTIDGRGFLLARDGTLTILEQLPGVASGLWRYLQPVAINDRGWIVGTGYRGETGRSFLITPK